MKTHQDHECIPVKLDVTAIEQGLILIESGNRQGQSAWIEHGVSTVRAQIERAIRLGGKNG